MSAFREGSRRGRIFLCAGFPVAAGLIGAVTSCAGLPAVTSTPPPPKSAFSPNRHFPLETTPDPVDLGILSRGRSAVAKITLRNSSEQPAIVQRIQTSCPCLHVERQSITLRPGESADLPVRFDSLDEPDFRGGLSIEVVGRGVTGGVVFATRVGVEIRNGLGNQPAPESATGRDATEPVTSKPGGAP